MVLLITCDTCAVAAGFREYVERKTDRQTDTHSCKNRSRAVCDSAFPLHP